MERFVLLTVSGLADGAVYALIALGFVLVYKATGVINFAQGDLVTLGAYVTLWAYEDQRLTLATAAIVGVVALGGVGAVLERVAAAPLRGRSVHVVVIATLGAALVMRSLLVRWQGTGPRRLDGFFGFETVDLLGARIPKQSLLVIAGAAVALALVSLLLQRTGFGRQVRALASDRETAQLQGIRTGRLSAAAFALAAALAAVGGILVAPTQQLTPTFGFGPMLFAFAAAIIGGFGRIGGVAAAAVLLGVLQQWATGYIDPGFREVYPFVLMLAILAVRPKGLLPEAVGARV